MSARVTWSGLDELLAQLRNMPAKFTETGGPIVLEAAEGAKAEAAAGYARHRKSGDLADHLTIEKGATAGRFGASARLKNTAKHASIFETGSQARHYYTKNGVKHLTGAMPAGKVFVPAVIRHRRVMYERLKAMLVDEGLQVSGDV